MGLFDDGDDESAQAYLQNALQQYNQVTPPPVAAEAVSNLPQETVQGAINPNQIQVAAQAPTAYDNISLDPSTRQAQINALDSYQGIANAGGLDANAKLGLQQTVDAANEQSQGDQGAIMKAAQAEGQGGGDFALTQRAIASQGASNTAATQGLQEAAEAEANREAALNQMASIGNNVEASDYNQAANKAASTNTINAANTTATNAANTTNVANNLTAQTENLQNKQNVNAANTTAGQNSAYYNAGLPQQQFNNELAKANGMNGIATTQANLANSAAENETNAQGQLIKGGLTALAAAAHGAAILPKCQYADGGTPHNHYMCMLMGGQVPGDAKVEGDSSQNDTQPALLSPGELVIPRSVPKDGKHMEEFAKHAPVGGDPKKKVDMTSFTKGYKRSK